MKEIALTGQRANGQVALVDDGDFPWLNHWRWYLIGDYARHKCEGKHIAMHRLIIQAKNREEVDHINHNTLDNRKANLRMSTHSQNCRNSPKDKSNTSGFKGVSWHKATRKWEAGIRVGGNRIHLGLFTDKLQAAVAYDNAAKRYHKAFASLNLPKVETLIKKQENRP